MVDSKSLTLTFIGTVLAGGILVATFNVFYNDFLREPNILLYVKSVDPDSGDATIEFRNEFFSFSKAVTWFNNTSNLVLRFGKPLFASSIKSEISLSLVTLLSFSMLWSRKSKDKEHSASYTIFPSYLTLKVSSTEHVALPPDLQAYLTLLQLQLIVYLVDCHLGDRQNDLVIL